MEGEKTDGHVAPSDPSVVDAASELEVVVQTPANPELVEGVAYQNPIETISHENGNGNGVGQKEPVKENAVTLASRLQHLSLSAQTVHADDFLNSHKAVAPPMHVSTTFRYSRNPEDLEPGNNICVRK
jgi:hypothetical protein